MAGEPRALPAEIRDLVELLQSQTCRPRRGIVRATLAVIDGLVTSAGGSALFELAKRVPTML
jgi:hypothetical protein